MQCYGSIRCSLCGCHHFLSLDSTPSWWRAQHNARHVPSHTITCKHPKQISATRRITTAVHVSSALAVDDAEAQVRTELKHITSLDEQIIDSTSADIAVRVLWMAHASTGRFIVDGSH